MPTINCNDEALRGLTCCFTLGGLTEGDTDHLLKTANTVTYCIDGFLYAQTAEAITPTVCAEQALGTCCLYLVSIDADTTWTVTKGKEVDTDDLDNGVAVLQWPELPADNCPVGKVLIETGATAFTMGVDDLTDDIGTGSVAYADLSTVPAEPETASVA